jgi:hypothetical protein
MYANGSYAPTWYQRRITRQVHEFAAEFGIGPARPGESRRVRREAPTGHRTGTGADDAEVTGDGRAGDGGAGDGSAGGRTGEDPAPGPTQLTLL